MNEEEFKKHLKDLAHGHHHPEEHDWPESGSTGAKTVKAKAPVKKAPVKKAVKVSPRKKASGSASRKG
jgi:hypothetical protein